MVFNLKISITKIKASNIRILSIIIFLFALKSSSSCENRSKEKLTETNSQPPEIIAKSFAYPIGEKELITEAKDAKDKWYNAQDFGENNHLGEDWNANSGGNTDCGEPVFAAADGEITYATDAGTGWGNVIIITHNLANGEQVQTLYGHLDRILKSDGFVKKREKIGTIGNADGKYLCHLHFELRDETCLLWNKVFIGYSPIRKGWLDPSDFIDKNH